MKQRRPSRALCALLIAALALSLALPALAADTELIVTAPETAPKAGESFTVTVELKGNPGFNTFDLKLGFDRADMRCTEIVTESALEGMMLVANPEAAEGAIVAAASTSAKHGNGLALTFRFQAARDLSGQALRVIEAGLGDSEGDRLPLTVIGPAAFPGGSGTASGGTEPTPAPNPAPQFTDIRGHWGEDWIKQAAELGLFKGNADGSFRPDAPVTRAQYLTVLYRMAGSPAVTAETPFTDLDGQIGEFRTAIAWGYEKGYINGRTETRFDPNGSITRQEAMKVLFGYAGGRAGTELMFTGLYDESYYDSDQLAAWGKGPMYWGVYHELLGGTAAHTLSPRGTASRAQLAKILVNYLEVFH